LDVGNQQNRGSGKQPEVANAGKAPQVKILLLGSGDSGKSTILKQLRLIHKGPFSAQEVESYRQLIFGNMVHGMRRLIEAMDEMGLMVPREDENMPHFEMIREQRDRYLGCYYRESYPRENHDIGDHEPYPREYHDALKALWRHPNVQQAWRRGHEAAVPENLSYFLSALDRLFDQDYQPTEQDILQCTVCTTGIAETKFMWGDREVVVTDTGGQRSERKKWINCFPGAAGVLFVASLSGYDQCMSDYNDVNQMEETISLWESICCSRWFQRTPIVLLLNKADLFEEKIKTSYIKDYFPDFDGEPKDAHAGREYFRRRFVQAAERKGRTNERAVHVHITAGTDTTMLRSVLTAVQEVVLQYGVPTPELE